MNPFEKALRELGDVVQSIQNKEGTIDLVKEVVESVGAMATAFEDLKGRPIEDKRKLLRDGLDAVIGEEVDALIGPTGSLVKFDIPFIGDEVATDLALGPMVNLAFPDNTDGDGN